MAQRHARVRSCAFATPALRRLAMVIELACVMRALFHAAGRSLTTLSRPAAPLRRFMDRCSQMSTATARRCTPRLSGGSSLRPHGATRFRPRSERKVARVVERAVALQQRLQRGGAASALADMVAPGQACASTPNDQPSRLAAQPSPEPVPRQPEDQQAAPSVGGYNAAHQESQQTLYNELAQEAVSC